MLPDVVLTASRKSQGDYCLNALVAGHKINLNATGDNKVATAVSSNADSDIKVTDGTSPSHRQQSMQMLRP